MYNKKRKKGNNCSPSLSVTETGPRPRNKSKSRSSPTPLPKASALELVLATSPVMERETAGDSLGDRTGLEATIGGTIGAKKHLEETTPSPPPTGRISQLQQPSHACSANESVTVTGPATQTNSHGENGVCLVLPKRKGLAWSDEEYADWFVQEWSGDARLRPSNQLRKMMKLVRRLVNRGPHEYFTVPSSLRCDVPAYGVTMKDLLTNFKEFLDQFNDYPDALDLLLAFPTTRDLLLSYSSHKIGLNNYLNANIERFNRLGGLSSALEVSNALRVSRGSSVLQVSKTVSENVLNLQGPSTPHCLVVDRIRLSLKEGAKVLTDKLAHAQDQLAHAQESLQLCFGDIQTFAEKTPRAGS